MFGLIKLLAPYYVHFHEIGAVLATCHHSYLVARPIVLGCNICQFQIMKAPPVSPSFQISVHYVLLDLMNAGIFPFPSYLPVWGNS